jgi:hypothetical protein
MGRALSGLSVGAALLSLAMNGFYGLKAARGNVPVDMSGREYSVQVGPTVNIPLQIPQLEDVLVKERLLVLQRNIGNC